MQQNDLSKDVRKMKKVSPKSKNIMLLTAVIAALAIVSAVLYVRVGRPMNELLKDVDGLKAWIAKRGWWARLVYMLLVCFQVLVAVIPGEPLELAAGFAFGPVEGTLICIAGITLGSVIIFALVRVFGVKLVERVFSREKIDSLKIMQNPKRLYIVTALLMILPGTPKDLLTYCAGLTKIPFTAWLLICSVGRIPSVITSTWGGHAVSEGNYLQAGIIFGVTALLCCAGLYAYGRMQDRKK